MLRDFAARYFPDAAGPTMTLKSCMFINSPDNHFIIDLHPDYPQVSYATGFSGHGYKFASVIGEIMADLAERQQTRHDISLFALDRLTGQLSALSERRRYPVQLGEEPQHGHLPSPVHHLYGRRQRPIPRALRQRRSRPLRIQQPVARHRFRPDRPSDRRDWRYPHHHRQPGAPLRDSIFRYYDSSEPEYWDQDDVKPFWL